MSKLKELLSDKSWLVEEHDFEVKKLNALETIFTVGNGYLGTRGNLEEGNASGWRGTYINGVFDHHQSFVVDLINAPDWTCINVRVNGEKLSLETSEVISHYRALDMKNGFLYRETKFKDSKGRVTNYESIRYANMSNIHNMEMSFRITPENYDGTIAIESAIDATTYNLDVEPALKEKKTFDSDIKWNKWARSIHTDHVETSAIESGIYLEVKTKERAHSIGYASALRLLNDFFSISQRMDFKYASEEIQVAVKKGVPVELVKSVVIYTSRDQMDRAVKQNCSADIAKIISTTPEKNYELHVKEWQNKWQDCSVVIKGDAKAEHAMKFNIYHLLITANPADPYANIGAKSLSGEGYKGHVFWDTEIFLLPFYALTQPETARSLMMYRFNTKEGARDYAKAGDYKGIRYPWESADTGHEVTPPWTSDGKIRIWTAEREQHITAAVVFGMVYYHTVSGDDQFMIDFGAEVLFETARFWESRLEYNKEADRYELTEVEGPDEFHELVNNSVYTNALTKWSLEQTVNNYKWLEETHPEKLKSISKSIQLEEHEIIRWAELAKKIYIPFDEQKQLVEQFENYFELEDIPITEWTENGMPKYPAGYHHDNCQETMLLKQPDVLMLMYVLPDMFSDEVKRANYAFYEPKTMHTSSLSPSIHSIMGVETDHYEKALQYFERSLYVDLIDNQGNTNDGMHIASCGGSWQALVCGFGGLRVKEEKMTFKPWLPPKWEAIYFKLKWKGDDLKVTLNQKQISFYWESKLNLPSDALEIEVKSTIVTLAPYQLMTINL